MRLLILALGLLAALGVGASPLPILRIATGELPPYATASRPDQGVALAIVRRAEERGVRLRDLSPAEWSALHPSFGAGLRARLDPAKAVHRRDHVGGTAPRRVKAAIARIRRFARSRAS